MTLTALDEFNDDIDWDYYELSVKDYWADDVTPYVIGKENLVTLTPSGRYRITGYVRNNDSVSVDNVRVQGTLYDEDGIVLDCRSNEVLNPDNLAPNGTSWFELDFTLRDDGYGDVDDYRLERQADPDTT
jgi:hypothetical protein